MPLTTTHRRLLVVLVAVAVTGACSGAPAPDPGDSTTTIGSGPQPVFTTVPPASTTITTTTPVPSTATTDPDGPDPSLATGLGDSRYPGRGNTGYDVDHYTLELEYHPDTGGIDGVATIDAVATQDLDVLSLDLVDLSVDEVTVDGTPAAVTVTSTDLIVAAPATLATGEGFSLAVSYTGRPAPFPTQALDFPMGWRSGPGGEQYVAAEPDAARTWFPANDHPLDKATYTFRLTVPDPLLAVANGSLTDVLDGEGDGDGTVTRVYEMNQPMPTYLATVVIGDYEVVEDPGSTDAGGVPIRNVLTAEVAADPPAVLDEQGEMMAFLVDRFGPYPFDLYGIAVVPDFPAALENSTLSLFGDSIVEDPVFETVLVHELAHQWFGDHVTLGDWGDLWLNEGFATYAEWLWVEEREGAIPMERLVERNHRIMRSTDLPPPGDPPADDLFNRSVYTTGGLTLHALRSEIGDDAFFTTLRTYLERHGGGTARTDDFVAVAEEVSGDDLGELFDAWLYGDTVPDL